MPPFPSNVSPRAELKDQIEDTSAEFIAKSKRAKGMLDSMSTATDVRPRIICAARAHAHNIMILPRRLQLHAVPLSPNPYKNMGS